MKKGAFTFVLHSHLPYCRMAGRWPHGEEWLHEAASETYIPLLNALYDLKEGGYPIKLTVGSEVNLERPLRVGQPVDGHFVQGHVDGMGTVRRVSKSRGQWTVWFDLARAELARYLVPKGSIAIDGVSLTVVDVLANSFSVALIPTTIERTTLAQLRAGDKVNIETDLLARRRGGVRSVNRVHREIEPVGRPDGAGAGLRRVGIAAQLPDAADRSIPLDGCGHATARGHIGDQVVVEVFLLVHGVKGARLLFSQLRHPHPDDTQVVLLNE